MNDSVHLIVGQCCEACEGAGEAFCEYANAMRTCPECMGTGVVDEDTDVLDEERKRELEDFAGDCIRNGGGDPHMDNAGSHRTSEAQHNERG